MCAIRMTTHQHDIEPQTRERKLHEQDFQNGQLTCTLISSQPKKYRGVLHPSTTPAPQTSLAQPVPSRGETSIATYTQLPSPPHPAPSISPVSPTCPPPVPSALLSGQVPPAPQWPPASPPREDTLRPLARPPTSRPSPSSASTEPTRVPWYASFFYLDPWCGVPKNDGRTSRER